MMLNFYSPSVHDDFDRSLLLSKISNVSDMVKSVDIEHHFNVETDRMLTPHEMGVLSWLLSTDNSVSSCVDSEIQEFGAQMTSESPDSSRSVRICQSCGLTSVKRVEVSRRLKFRTANHYVLSQEELEAIIAIVHDKMKEEQYFGMLATFDTGVKPEPMIKVDIFGQGMEAINKINNKLGLGMDEQAKQHLLSIVQRIKRNLTLVEIREYAVLTSEHCRHGFFNAVQVIDSEVMPYTLFELVKSTLMPDSNATIAFHDNSSAIEGFKTTVLVPKDPTQASDFERWEKEFDFILTVETHNYPTLWHPFQGATTGTGGVFRDIFGTGRGAHLDATIIGYSVGQVSLPGFTRPWEQAFVYDSRTASPIRILVEGSNGGTDYCNKIGVCAPVGITREFEMNVPGQGRWGYVKPILLAGASGHIEKRDIVKAEPTTNPKMVIIRFGGPDRRVGIGGGNASSLTQGQNTTELDESAVQRGDAGVEQSVWRAVVAAIKLPRNIFQIITDEGAGGNSVALSELSKLGAFFDITKFTVADSTLSVDEIWVNESQERMVAAILETDLPIWDMICQREGCDYDIVGEVTDDMKIRLINSSTEEYLIDMDLADILAELPQKTFESERIKPELFPLELPVELTVLEALERVFLNITVGSKGFLMQKGDRSVRGNTKQQQCCGPLHLPVADCAVVTLSHFDNVGHAISIGEQPIIGFINFAAMGRRSAAESITNMIGTKIADIKNIKFSLNWMWAAKLKGQGANMYDTAIAIRDLLWAWNTGIFGGKDSLSMAADIYGEMVRSPGTVVFTAIADVPNITKVITPDIKHAGSSNLLFVDMAEGKTRLGASILAQVFSQIGNECPDVDNPTLVLDAFKAVQELVGRGLISAVHDISDGGLITCFLEMAFSGNCGLDINISTESFALERLFAEETGVVVEYDPSNSREIFEIFEKHGLLSSISDIGKTRNDYNVTVSVNNDSCFESDTQTLRAIWERMSFEIERTQKNLRCAEQERAVSFDRQGPTYIVPFTPRATPNVIIEGRNKPIAAVLRGEGSNGDEEMRTFFHLAGFDVIDVHTSDLVSGKVSLDKVKTLATVGGFTYSDVFGSARGWAGVVKFNPRAKDEIDKFFARKDVTSFHVCNGCQWAFQMGIVPGLDLPEEERPQLVRNESGVFEHRYPTVRFLPSDSPWLRDMEGMTLGIWTAHGEGRFEIPNVDYYFDNGMIPLVYVDDDGNNTEVYPLNPNGSVYGVAGMTSRDGRHFAMMPHSERLHRIEIFPHLPSYLMALPASPYIKLTQNAHYFALNS